MALKIWKVNLGVSNLSDSVKEKLCKDMAEFQITRPGVCTVSETAVIV